jgi:hypothetical protein
MKGALPHMSFGWWLEMVKPELVIPKQVSAVLAMG